MNILLKSVTIVHSKIKSLHLKKRDILIKNGVIAAIETSIEPKGKTNIINEKNLHVSLGWFDSGVSFGEPGYEERETIENGLLTAAKSGFTDIILNTSSHPTPDSSSDIVYLKNAAKDFLTKLHPLGNLTVKGESQALAELYDMKNAGAIGFYDYKHPLTNANLLKIALQYAQNFDGLVFSFPMDTSISGKGIVNEGITSTKLGLKGIPTLAEELQIARDLFILEYTGGKLFIPTISTANSVKLIADAKKKGLQVYCSVAVHNLVISDEALEDFDTQYKVMPPLRTAVDIKALQKGVKNGTIDFVTSDHTPLNVELKHVEFDNACFGTIGLESTFGMLNELLGIEDTIELLTKGRSVFGIKEPELKVEQPANLSLFTTDDAYKFSEDQILSSSKNSMAIGKPMKGKVVGSIANNQLILNK
ncbi:dihydroorotase [Maribacter hydrothermalis]|uniref:Dihydroorotase n=1 Tax=Maribacter hydrothermalis TaxID=1836467 RepID=A0A1B7ZCJ9_9FLAO|nr:dihydroorotase [Maribacter hydrothermalis]APQ18587.1 dihydroorotase [Maribacter hydrothermalis]OBR40857.1 dihydroorotase [Maribacter hydrothermalis]